MLKKTASFQGFVLSTNLKVVEIKKHFYDV